jgi:hypothetical protein
LGPIVKVRIGCDQVGKNGTRGDQRGPNGTIWAQRGPEGFRGAQRGPDLTRVTILVLDVTKSTKMGPVGANCQN